MRAFLFHFILSLSLLSSCKKDSTSDDTPNKILHCASDITYTNNKKVTYRTYLTSSNFLFQETEEIRTGVYSVTYNYDDDPKSPPFYVSFCGNQIYHASQKDMNDFFLTMDFDLPLGEIRDFETFGMIPSRQPVTYQMAEKNFIYHFQDKDYQCYRLNILQKEDGEIFTIGEEIWNKELGLVRQKRAEQITYELSSIK